MRSFVQKKLPKERGEELENSQGGIDGDNTFGKMRKPNTLT